MKRNPVADEQGEDAGGGSISPASSRLMRKASLSDHVYTAIFQRIVSGEFAVGARLPTEAELSANYSVSRPVLREALARLRDDGLITSLRGSGSYVQSRPHEATLRFSPIESIADLQRCYEFREGLESMAAQMAALRRTEHDLSVIGEAAERLAKAVATGQVGTEEDLAFHVAIARASKNRFLMATFDSLQNQVLMGIQLARNLSLMRTKERLGIVQEEHEAIWRAIRDGDGDAAGRAMWRHINNAKRRSFEGEGTSESANDA